MAKNKRTYDALSQFSGSFEVEVDSRTQRENSNLEPTEPRVLETKETKMKQVLQGKQGKEKKKYEYGTKHTFPIPDDLWSDAILVMRLMNTTQVDYIQGLIRASVETNRDAINTIKKIRGEL